MPAFRTALETVIEGKMADRSDLEKRLGEIRNAISTNPELRHNEQIRQLHQQFRRLVEQACTVVKDGVGGGLSFGTSVGQPDKLQFAPFYFEATRHVHHDLVRGKGAMFRIYCGQAGDEYILSGESRTGTLELARIPIQGPVNWSAVETTVGEFVAAVVAELFEP
jgi:hypothetical protein